MGVTVSWKTTVAAILSSLAAIFMVLAAYFDGDPATIPNWETAAIAVLAIGQMIIGVFTKDNDKSTEDHKLPRKRLRTK